VELQVYVENLMINLAVLGALEEEVRPGPHVDAPCPGCGLIKEGWPNDWHNGAGKPGRTIYVCGTCHEKGVKVDV
jgi:hypothetical protein